MLQICEVCQRTKITNCGRHDQIPLKEPPNIALWELISVDLCGPWKVDATIEEEHQRTKAKTIKTIKKRVKIWALTIIDEASVWLEIIPITNKLSKNIALLFDSKWFCRYPRPTYCIYDNGKEFIGNEFNELLDSYGIKKKPTTGKNPQANAVHERTHLLVEEMLRTLDIIVPMKCTVDQEVRRVLQSVAFDLRATISTITKYSPGQLVFGWDMVIDQLAVVDWSLLRERKGIQQARDNERENRGRTNFQYKVGKRVLVITKTNERRGKLLDYEHKGPYEIVKVYANGTIKMKCGNFNEIINIRRVRPYYKKFNNIGTEESARMNILLRREYHGHLF